jgi:AraC-like DNA-binding protein
MGARSAGNPHAACDVEGAGNVARPKLGHRSFNAFLNQWRLADAKAALSDPAQASVPISTIALDAGFGSLGPFNRAFGAETGKTPSEFRAQALGGGSSLR